MSGTGHVSNAGLSKSPLRHWSPRSFEGLLFWVDAKDASTISLATGASQWRDKGPLKDHLTQPTGANQPTYVTTPYNQRGVFFGDDYTFLQPGANAQSGAWMDDNGATLMYVITPDSGYSVNALMANGDYGDNYLVLDNGDMSIMGESSVYYAGRYWPTGSMRRGWTKVTKGTRDVYLNLDKSNENYVYTWIDTGAERPDIIGNDIYNIIAPIGTIHEMFMYDRELAPHELDVCYQYLKNRWPVVS